MRNVMKDVAKGALSLLALATAVAVLIGAVVAINYFNEPTRHEKAVAELRSLQAIYLTARPEQKPTLRSIIIDRVERANSANLPDDLYFFVDDMRRKSQSPSYVDE